MREDFGDTRHVKVKRNKENKGKIVKVKRNVSLFEETLTLRGLF